MMLNNFPKETVYAYPNWHISGHYKSISKLEEAQNFRLDNGPTAIYVHVPFCYTLCQFCGFTKTDDFNKSDLDDFVKITCAEIDLVADKFQIFDRSIDAIYFGGGTASVLSINQVERIFKHIYATFNVKDNAELSFEGECRSMIKTGFVEGLAKLGFNRISFGVQTMDVGARKALNLKPTIKSLVDLTRKGKALFEEVAVDFIYGWPGQTTDMVLTDINELCEKLEPTVIEVFQFEKSDASPSFLNHLYNSGLRDASTEELQKQMEVLETALRHRGFSRKSFTIFANSTFMPTQKSSNYLPCFYGYNASTVLGFGRGAQSWYGGYMWSCSLLPETHKTLIENGTLPVSVLGNYDTNEREATSWVRRGWVSKHFVNDQDDYYVSKINELIKNGYVLDDSNKYLLTDLGWKWIPSLLYFLMPEHQQALYSRDFDFNEIGRVPVN
ncbi:radical SAM protein [Flavivirga sp. 57AJ16]|uniref:radical SAM protein n=1 Tax=Flavivirga sp. 57AJ16 TaxID=3025307 RepID=UPI0023671593|nr:radical SAM protein [Flavivirga sp. 57AJ16]MDD7887911.1 radical SAM protein [Flavivirga sp. 57AJ16]